MLALLRDLATVGEAEAPVLIEGETGVGKTLIAKVLHHRSARAQAPFVSVSAPNLPEELFESELFGHVKGAFSGAVHSRDGLARSAHGGTLFLDEVGELSPRNQAKLLHFLDTGQVRPVGGVRSEAVDVRIFCATNRNLQARVEAGRFRRDLYYRLRVFHLHIPPLRSRRGDIPLLVEHFFHRLCKKYGKQLAGISAPAHARLCDHHWEGNIRELENEMERLVAMTPDGESIKAHRLSHHVALVEEDHEPETLDDPNTLESVRRKAERQLIREALIHNAWNVSATARELRISRVGLSRKLRRLGIRRPGG